jgi:hypothetical protein
MNREGTLFFHFLFPALYFLVILLLVLFVCLYSCLYKLVFLLIFSVLFLYPAIERTTMRSIVDLGLCSNSLTCIQAQRPTSHTLLHECDRTHLSAIDCTRSEPSCDPF